MRVLFAVILDLWHFCSECFFGTKTQPAIAKIEPVQLLAPVEAPLLLHEEKKSLALPVEAVMHRELTLQVVDASTDYISVAEAMLHTEPVVAFDNVRSRLPYGTPVGVSKRSGRWAQVTSGSALTGWIRTEQLEAEKNVFPQFSLGKTYDASNSETLKLRLCIHDQFQAGVCALPLSGGEYVTYRLWQAHQTLSWSASYGRVLGTWHRKLRGVRGVHLDVMPRTGSIMEYIVDEVGYVAFIESVTPELRIKISAVGLTFEGQYSEQTMTHEDWRELHPVFIGVV